MANRDEFSKSVIETLAKRVGVCCSNPSCRKSTAGPRDNPEKSVNIGVAAHITAAAEGGPRYDASLSVEERGSIENGIWLCQDCAKLIDNDHNHYSKKLLDSWKAQAEETARSELEGTTINSNTQAIADLVLEWQKIKILPERHDYKLNLSIHNVGTRILREYHVDLEIPSAVLMDTNGTIEGRSDADKSLFRSAWCDAEDDIFPRDKRTVISIPYFMNHQLYSNRGDLLDCIVSATFYQRDQPQVVIERRFDELQCF